MLKMRRSIDQTLQGTPPSCEIPRIFPLAPCVPPEDVPPTRIPRTARDGAAQSVKPMGAAGFLVLWFSTVTNGLFAPFFICMLTVVHAPTRRAGRLRLPVPFRELAARAK
jgi:hypothetical protein